MLKPSDESGRNAVLLYMTKLRQLARQGGPESQGGTEAGFNEHGARDPAPDVRLRAATAMATGPDRRPGIGQC